MRQTWQAAGRRGEMAPHCQIECDDRSFRCVGDAGAVAPINQRMRQHEEQVAHAKFTPCPVARSYVRQKVGKFGTNAIERSHRSKKGIEQCRTHTVMIKGQIRRRKADRRSCTRYIRPGDRPLQSMKAKP